MCDPPILLVKVLTLILVLKDLIQNVKLTFSVTLGKINIKQFSMKFGFVYSFNCRLSFIQILKPSSKITIYGWILEHKNGKRSSNTRFFKTKIQIYDRYHISYMIYPSLAYPGIPASPDFDPGNCWND